MKILLIGGSGFIGPYLIDQLQQLGNEVAVFHRGSSKTLLPAGIDEIIGDRKDLAAYRAQLRACQPEIVIDIILSSGAQAAELMETFRGLARRVIALSSIDVYRACGVLHGTEPGPLEPLPLTETSALRSQPAYPAAVLAGLQRLFGWLDEGYDKVAVERAVMNDGALPGTVLRLPMIYGPGDPLHRFFPILKRIDDNRSQIIFEAELAAWRSPRGYVENVAAAIALAAINEKAAGRIYNVAEAESFSELAWASMIAEQTGWQGEFVILPKERVPQHLLMPANLAQHWAADSARIRNELGYREPIPLAQAISNTIKWQRENPPAQIDAAKFDYAAEDAALNS